MEKLFRLKDTAEARALFGTHDENLKIIEVPIHYAARTYGETNISRFSDGFTLLRMVAFAFMKLKAL